ncbi:TonB family protein [Lysobacter yangpyeongensis]|jgi:TonB family protein|uniref:Protein TonB n=1 Tax=Lysobacter yangpyeongensis TaxID=346182 RepID=A0ABW0SN32_9GAMM
MDSAEFVRSLVETAIASSAAILLVMLLRRVLRAAFGARLAYAAWWLVPVAIIAVLLPAARDGAVPPSVQVLMQAVMPTTGSALDATSTADRSAWLFAFWLAGACASALWFLGQQRAFRRVLGRVQARGDGLFQAQSIAGLPAVMGVWRPRIVVPADFDDRYGPEERTLLREHERAHIRHGDLQSNALAVLLRCVFWFNPLLHAVARHFRHDQELACDQRVIARHPQARRCYGEAMLKTQLAAQPLPLGCHWGFSHPLKERIAMLKVPAPTKRRRLAGAAFLLVFGLASAYAAWAMQPGDAAAIPAGNIQVKLSLQIDDGAIQENTYVVPEGGRFVMSATAGGHEWNIDATAAPGKDELLMFDSRLSRDGKLMEAPKIGLRNGQPGVIQVGTDHSAAGGKFEGVRIEVTLTQSGPPVAVEANADPAAALAPPAYPRQAVEQKLDGTVMLLVDMDADGRVTGVQVDHAEPAGVFEAAAIEAAWKWRFTPARKDGKAVPGRVKVPVTFKADRPAAGSATPKA